MRTILITGLSGTGKSSAIEELRRHDYNAIDTDEPGWCVPSMLHDSEWLWDEDRMAQLLDRPPQRPLFVSGCRSNQGRFYDRFDCIVLLTAPLDVMLARVATRTTNPYGSRPGEREAIVRYKDEVEPLLRRGANVEIDTGLKALPNVVAQLIALSTSPRAPRGPGEPL